jgi:hypothetical protein
MPIGQILVDLAAMASARFHSLKTQQISEWSLTAVLFLQGTPTVLTCL